MATTGDLPHQETLERPQRSRKPIPWLFWVVLWTFIWGTVYVYLDVRVHEWGHALTCRALGVPWDEIHISYVSGAFGLAGGTDCLGLPAAPSAQFTTVAYAGGVFAAIIYLVIYTIFVLPLRPMRFAVVGAFPVAFLISYQLSNGIAEGAFNHWYHSPPTGDRIQVFGYLGLAGLLLHAGTHDFARKGLRALLRPRPK